VNLKPTTLPDLRTTDHGPRATNYGARSLSFATCRSQIGNAAFTLLEILVSVGLLSFIVLGLFAMFHQTQRAFRSSMTQSDILEAGRAVTEMIPRELEQMIPSRHSPYPLNPYTHGVNFYTEIPNSTPLTQPLPGNPLPRTNLLQDCFILLRQNQTWTGIGYCVRGIDTNHVLWYPQAEPGKMGAGTLYRFTETLAGVQNGLAQDPSRLFGDFVSACQPGTSNTLTRICDGVIHFYFRAFDTNGVLITTNHTNIVVRYYPNLAPGEVGGYTFFSNALPATVEMELGLLEQYTWERYNSIGDPAARRAYLQREDISTRVHLFRQRIPIRNVDPLAYQ
jgi:hypothetical protein